MLPSRARVLAGVYETLLTPEELPVQQLPPTESAIHSQAFSQEPNALPKLCNCLMHMDRPQPDNERLPPEQSVIDPKPSAREAQLS